MNRIYLLTIPETEKRLESLYGSRLVRYLAEKALGVTQDRFNFAKDANGKPYLHGFEGFHFNISHTSGAVVVAVSDRPVGVDVEKVRAVRVKIAERFFTCNECRYILSENYDVNRRFFEVWTRKEAWLKQSGTGIRVALDSFDVLAGELSERIHTLFEDGYIISCCCEGEAGRIERVDPDILPAADAL